MNEANAALMTMLHAPFEPSEIEWKPQTVAKDGNRALAVAYVDARVIMTRLDRCFGLGGWQTSYDVLPDGSVVCTLRIRVGQEWTSHQDVGSPSAQPGSGDRLKAAFSDSLKRAAVHLGIGRYLYRLPAVWCDYDPRKKRFARTPELPDWAIPAKRKAS
jgi:hypothetical protein